LRISYALEDYDDSFKGVNRYRLIALMIRDESVVPVSFQSHYLSILKWKKRFADKFKLADRKLFYVIPDYEKTSPNDSNAEIEVFLDPPAALANQNVTTENLLFLSKYIDIDYVPGAFKFENGVKAMRIKTVSKFIVRIPCRTCR